MLKYKKELKKAGFFPLRKNKKGNFGKAKEDGLMCPYSLKWHPEITLRQTTFANSGR